MKINAAITLFLTLSTLSAAVLTRGPYLQSGSPTNVILRWRTDLPTSSRVRFGESVDNLNLRADEPASTSEHEVNLTGLEPDTKYFYSIDIDDQTQVLGDTNHFVVTSPPPGTRKPARIWVIGDAGTGTASQRRVRDAYEAFTGSRHTDLWLMLGDNAYSEGHDSEYQRVVFNVYTNLLRKSVLWSTLGNHDVKTLTPSGSHPYFDIFTLPKNGEAGGIASGRENYYSFTHGNIHFICLDSMASSRARNSAMAMWLTNDLASITADWIIAFFHHPPYSKGSHNSDTEIESVEMRENILPLLEGGGVDLVLSGHSHSYERSFLLNRHYGSSTSFSGTNKMDGGDGCENGTGAYRKPAGRPLANQGTVYAVVGSSGEAQNGLFNHPAMYVSLRNLGSLILDIDGNRLNGMFLREDGTTNDCFTVLKINYPPTASNLTVSVAVGSSMTLTLSASDLNRDELTFSPSTQPEHGLISAFDPESGAFTYRPAHGYSGTDRFNFRVSDGQLNSPEAIVLINVAPLNDFDGDSLPDEWESRFALNNPIADADHDGLNNAQEYWANTNPLDPDSTLRIVGAGMDEKGYFSFTWASVGGTRYRLSYCDEVPDGPFTDIALPVAEEIDSAPSGTASTKTFTDHSAPASGAFNGGRYYRVRVTR